MPSIRTDPSVAEVSTDASVDATPAPDRVERRLLNRRLGEWGKQFALRLKTKAQWIKKFLHGSR